MATTRTSGGLGAQPVTQVGLHQMRGSRFVPGPLEQAVNSALSRGPGYEATPIGKAYDVSRVSGYYIDFSSKTRSRAASDVERLLPGPLAQLALGWWERKLAGEQQALDEFLRVSTQLVESASSVGAELRWPMPLGSSKYHVRPGACSALAQGQAASALIRAYHATRDERYADYAHRAVLPLLTDRSSDLVCITAVGPVLEELPTIPASHILNGWISGLWGIKDVHLALGDERAGRVFEAGVDSLRLHLPSYDVGWWSRYSLYPHVVEDLAKPIYHRYHIDQLRVMHALTGAHEFAQTAERWASYDHSWRLVALILQKGLFAFADGRRRRSWIAAG